MYIPLAGQKRAEDLEQGRKRPGLLEGLAELAHRVLVGHRIGQVKTQETLDGKAVQDLVSRSPVGEPVNDI